ncbi:MAG: FAD-binding oxidoreductase [Chloroflexi bacterium]|nr:FAD-binding oxidoreductase [Chloroflexota bacterium]
MTDAPLEHLVPLPTPAAPLSERADVVIIGGGIMGTSVAFHLAEAGVRDIAILERDTVGSGSSAKPLGGVRATFSDPGNIVLGQRSLDAFEGFDARFRTDIGLRQVGYLFLARTPEEAAALEASAELQNRMGGDTRPIDARAATELNPYLDQDAIVAASFSPRDGYARPARVVAAYRAAAEALGATTCEHTEVLGIAPGTSTVHDVHTNRGSVGTDTIVIAAGAWSRRIGAMVGVDLPVEPLRRAIGVTRPLRPAPPVIPFTLDLSTTLYVHGCDDDRLLVGISHPEQAVGFGREFGYDWVPAFDRAAAVIAPTLVGLTLTGGWAGLYEDTPDHNALIGRARDVEGVLYATGFSGHGFLQGPAVGELVRDLHLGRDSFLDPAPFSTERFRDQDTRITELHII